MPHLLEVSSQPLVVAPCSFLARDVPNVRLRRLITVSARTRCHVYDPGFVTFTDLQRVVLSYQLSSKQRNCSCSSLPLKCEKPQTDALSTRLMALGIRNACSCVSPDVWIDAIRSNDLTLQAKFTKHFREVWIQPLTLFASMCLCDESVLLPQNHHFPTTV